MHVGIIGGGVAGLVAAYELCKSGIKVTLFESEATLGGLTGSFSLDDGHEIERYYHFICKPDQSYFKIMKDLGIYSKLHWVISEMGIFYQGKLHSVSDLLSLLKFPELSLSEKLRLAWSTFKCKYRDPSDWHDFENLSAQEWLTSLYGEHIYRIFYEFLLNLKFRSYAPKISAAWFWARINRLANSRSVSQKECLGYLEGGTKTFINALERAIRERGGEIYLKTPVAEVVVHEGLATGIRCDGKFYGFDHIISTVPIPVFSTLFPAMDGPYVNNLNSLNYIDVIVMVMHLSQRFS